MANEKVKYLTRAGIIAAIYVVLTVIMGELSFGSLQFRISEALVLLPYADKAAVPGVYVGCLIANIFGGYGFVDIFFGSLVTLLSAYLTSKMPNKILAVVPPVVLNAFIVSIWVSKFTHTPYYASVISIGLSEFFCVAGLGMLLLIALEKIKQYK